jgi:hypothetical protein
MSVALGIVSLIRYARAFVRKDFLRESAVNNRRFRLPAAIAGSIGIILTPALAEAATGSSQASATQGIGVQHVGQAQFSSPVSRLVAHRAAIGDRARSMPDPNLAVGLSGYDSSSHAVAFIVSLAGFSAGTSNLNFQANQNVANLVVVPVGANGTVDFHNGSPSGSAQVIADVAGYYTASARSAFAAVGPTRILDTATGVGAAKAQTQADSSIDVTVAGADGIPADATAVALNLTAADSADNGLITAYPAGESLPTVSSLNYTAGSARANMAIVPVGTNGQVAFENNSDGPVDLIADATAYYTKSAVTGASAYIPLRSPIRYIDTRPGSSDGYEPGITGPLNALMP